jgi:hypothetical protein
MKVVFASLAKGDFSLALVDAAAGAVAVAVAVAANMAGAIRVAAPLAAGIKLIGAVVPTAQARFVIPPLGFFTTLDFGG